MGTYGDRCRQVGTGGDEWRQVETGRESWRQVLNSGDRWRQTETVRDRWGQIQTGGDRWRQQDTERRSNWSGEDRRPGIGGCGGGGADLTSSLAVVLVHGAQGVALTPGRRVLRQVVDELATEPGSILDVVRATPPVPALGHGAPALQPGVTATLRHVALAAGPRDGVHESSCHHCVDEGGFFGS